MTTEIIPAIVPSNQEQTIEQITAARGFSPVFQIDIGDGTFTPHKTLQSKDIADSLLRGHPYELHLMVSDPTDYVHEWLGRSSRPIRIILHVESSPSAFLLQEIEHEGVEPMMGIVATSSSEAFDPYLHLVRSVLFLSIDPPGGQGQKFIPGVLKQMRDFHQAHPSYTIESDGGITEATMEQVIQCGATRVVVGSQIFSTNLPPEERFVYLTQLAKQYSEEAKI